MFVIEIHLGYPFINIKCHSHTRINQFCISIGTNVRKHGVLFSTLLILDFTYPHFGCEGH